MLGVSWTHRVTDADEKGQRSSDYFKKKKALEPWLATFHNVPHGTEADPLLQSFLQGKSPGKKKVGKESISVLKNLSTCKSKSTTALFPYVVNRKNKPNNC